MKSLLQRVMGVFRSSSGSSLDEERSDVDSDIRTADIASNPLEAYFRSSEKGEDIGLLLFDADYYRSEYSDVAHMDNPFEHFVTYGHAEGRRCHPLFDEHWYRQQTGDIGRLHPLSHFLSNGGRQGLSPHPLFDSDWYADQLGMDTELSGIAIAHYLSEGGDLGLSPHPAFDAKWYLRENPDVVGTNPLVHYLRFGWREGRDPHPLFDVEWYLETYADIASADVEPLQHWLAHGWKEGRKPCRYVDMVFWNEHHDVNPLVELAGGGDPNFSPHPLFDGDFYNHRYPECLVDFGCAFAHFVRRGIAHGHSPNALFDEAWYLEANRDIDTSKYNLVDHYIAYGASEDRVASPFFDPKWYRERYSVPAEVNTVADFIATADLSRNPHPFVDTEWIAHQQGIDDTSSYELIARLIVKDHDPLVSPHPLVDLNWYAKQPGVDVDKAGFRYFFTHPTSEISFHPLIDVDFLWQKHEPDGSSIIDLLVKHPEVSPHPLFDSAHYLLQTGPLPKGEIPLAHYLKNGAESGYDPHPLFQTQWYLKEYPDVDNSGQNPLVHFVKAGYRERRRPNPMFDTSFYMETNPDVASGAQNPLTHFCQFGYLEGRNPNPFFDLAWYRQTHMGSVNGNPLQHYFGVQPRQDTTSVPEDVSLPGMTQALADYRDVVPWRAHDFKQVFRFPAWVYLYEHFGVRDALQTMYDLMLFELFDISRPALGQSDDGQRLRTEEIETALRRLALNRSGPEVDVSIIIPAYNQHVHTMACVVSLSRWKSKYSFEIIIADDCSPELDTQRHFGDSEAVNYLRSDLNQGFLRNCNAAASRAKGNYLVFLNNDTYVLPGWLDELIDTMKQPGVGLAGSKLVFASGALQEAGGLIWEDGSGWNFGRGGDASFPHYNFARSADYCSGASIAISKLLWEEIGGFDERYVPAYYEDTDLAFEVRRRGYSVVYQPLSQLFHFEGISHGTDVAVGTKRYQEINRAKFVDKWREVLAQHSKPLIAPDEFYFDGYRSGHVLFVDHTTPTPDQDSGSVDAVHLMHMLLDMDLHVSFCPAGNYAHMGRYTRDLQRRGVECLTRPLITDLGTWLSQHGSRLSCVILTRVWVAHDCIDWVEKYAPQASIVFNTTDLHYLRLSREAELKDDDELREKAELTKHAEFRIAKRAQLTIVVGSEEQKILEQEVSGVTAQQLSLPRLIPGRSNPYHARNKIAFLGNYEHPPNLDAVEFFVDEVWPEVRRRLPGKQLVIAGAKMPLSLYEFSSEDVEVVGFVEDLETFFSDVLVFVAPLRYGAGQKGKVVSALGHGVPVVGTSIAMESMGLENGVHALWSDDASEFAELVVELASNENQWTRLSEAGLKAVGDEFGYENVERRFVGMMNQLLSS